MKRRGHGRPVGTITARFRFRVFADSDYTPQLGHLMVETPLDVERAYRIVGIEETRDPRRYGLYLERLAWSDEAAATADAYMERDR